MYLVGGDVFCAGLAIVGRQTKGEREKKVEKEKRGGGGEGWAVDADVPDGEKNRAGRLAVARMREEKKKRKKIKKGRKTNISYPAGFFGGRNRKKRVEKKKGVTPWRCFIPPAFGW